jgi:hypothetical protein
MEASDLDEFTQGRVDSVVAALDEAMGVLADLAERAPRVSRLADDSIT